MQKYKKKVNYNIFLFFLCTFAAMKAKILVFLTTIMAFVSCHETYEHKTVICIPVYGQSLALGEEAERITDFDSLATYADGRIITENLDHNFGYFDNDDMKQFAKKVLHYHKRSFELSIYRMAQKLADATGNDTLICIFPGGQGTTTIANMSKGTAAYQKFIDDIETAYEKTTVNGWEFIIPAICWMQGESDIEDYPETNFMQLLKKIRVDMNSDINQITHQEKTIPFICYQTNSLARAKQFDANNYLCRETAVPQAFVDLISHDSLFWASGPTYPYACVDERIHIDAIGQQSIGVLAAKSALDIIRRQERFKGLIPLNIISHDTIIAIQMNVPYPPLTIDTIQVRKTDNYGFSVINQHNQNIVKKVVIERASVIIHCSESPNNCRVRYAVNGVPLKNGNLHGPRGNLRDSQGDSLTIHIEGKDYPIYNWCYQFDMHI